jgi:hypothetical protein
MGNLALALLGGLLAAAPALAQAPPTKAAPAKAPAYDPKAELTITGVVDDLHESKLRADHPGLHLSVKTETETVEVHTCPVGFMKDLEFTVEKGDAVTIIGSRPGGAGVVLAREIKKGQTSLSCRDKAGVPVWTR